MIRNIAQRNWKQVVAVLALSAVAGLAPARGGLFEDLARIAVDRFEQPSAPRVSVPPASNSFSHCPQLFPEGRLIEVQTIDAQWQPVALCSSAFAVLYSGRTKTPIVVVERMTRGSLQDSRGLARTNIFYADSRLPRAERAELADYRGSGFDKGHMSPAADQPNQSAMEESFSLSNMVPQDPKNNREIWSKVEADTRHYVQRARGDVFVFTGALFHGTQHVIGLGRVWVPSHLFKLVYDPTTSRAWAHVLPNSADARIGPPMSYQEFVAFSGMDLLGADVSARLQAAHTQFQRN